MEQEFITITEAVRITGKTDVDLMRLLKEKLQSSGLALESIVKREQTDKGNMVLLRKDFLLQDVPSQVQEPAREDGGAREILRAKDEMIATLQRIIETKDTHIESLASKIDELIARDRETNILLKGLQDRVFLLEDARAPEKKKAEKQNRP